MIISPKKSELPHLMKPLIPSASFEIWSSLSAGCKSFTLLLKLKFKAEKSAQNCERVLESEVKCGKNVLIHIMTIIRAQGQGSNILNLAFYAGGIMCNALCGSIYIADQIWWSVLLRGWSPELPPGDHNGVTLTPGPALTHITRSHSHAQAHFLTSRTSELFIDWSRHSLANQYLWC